MVRWIGIVLGLYAGSAVAQSSGVTVHGNVQDSSGAVLEGATVNLLRLPDSALIKATRNVKNGFTLRRIARGSYVIGVTFVGYRRTFLRLDVPDGDSLLQLPVLKLPPSSDGSMLEVVVRASIPPVIAKSDTLIYAASAFKTRPNASVEELLKKLPGVTVDASGQVMVNGQKVEKFYIDGKEIPVSDAQALTRTLRSDMVQGIEAFDRQTDDSRFSGIKDHDGAKGLNIRVKKAYQHSLSGKLYAGYGEMGSYGAGGDAFYLGGDLKGQLSVDHANNNSLINGQPGRQFFMSPGVMTRTNVNAFGSWQTAPSKAANGGYYFNDSRGRNQGTENRQTFTGDSSLLLQHFTTGTNSGNSHNLMGSWRLAPDSMTELSFSPQANKNRQQSVAVDSQNIRIVRDSSSYLSGRTATSTVSSSDNWSYGGDLHFRHRFKKDGSAMHMNLQAREGNSTTDRSFLSSSSVYDPSGGLASETKLNQVSHQTAPESNLSGGLGYSHPIGHKFILDGNYTVNLHRQRSDKATYNYDSATGKYSLPDTLTTNSFKTHLLNQHFSVGINRNGLKFQFQAGLSLQSNRQKSHTISGHGQDVDLNQLNWAPRIGFFYNIDQRDQLNLQYSGSTNGASVDQLQPLPDLSNPLLIRKGNPDLHPEFNHYLSVGYQHYSQNRLQSLMVQLSSSLQQNKFTPNTTLQAGGVQVLQFVNSNGNYSSDLTINYNFPFAGGRKGNGRIGSAISLSHAKSLTNGASIVQENLGWRPEASVNYSPMDRLLVEARADLDLHRSQYTGGGQNLSQVNQHYTLGLSYELSSGWLVTSDLVSQITGPQAGLKGQSQELWNASIGRRILPKKTAEIRISAYDILSQNKGFSQSTGDNYISTSNNLVLSRTLYVSCVYYFKAPLKRT